VVHALGAPMGLSSSLALARGGAEAGPSGARALRTGVQLLQGGGRKRATPSARLKAQEVARRRWESAWGLNAQESRAGVGASRSGSHQWTEFFRKGDPDGAHGHSTEWEVAEWLWEVAGDREAAERFFEAAAERNPHNGSIYAGHATFVWSAFQDVCRAGKLFEMATLMDPTNIDALAASAYFEWKTEGMPERSNERGNIL